MKKKLVCLLLATTMAFSMVACDSKGKDSTEAVAEENGDMETYGKVELGQYKGLEAEKLIYEVSETDIDTSVSNLVEENCDYNAVTRNVQEGDLVEFKLTGKIGEEVIYDFTDEATSTIAGDEDYGEGFETALYEHKAGDNYTVSVSYEADYLDATVAGKTVDYEVTLTDVSEIVRPELTEDFIINTLGYESESDMREKLKAELQAENEEQSAASLSETLLNMVIENSTFTEYSEDLYNTFLEDNKSTYTQYAEMFGMESLEEYLEFAGMTMEDLEAETLNQVYGVIAVQEIARVENITATEDEIKAEAEALAATEGFDSGDELLESYGKDTIEFWLVQEKVYDFLVQNAVVTEVAAPEEDDSFDDFSTEMSTEAD